MLEGYGWDCSEPEHNKTQGAGCRSEISALENFLFTMFTYAL